MVDVNARLKLAIIHNAHRGLGAGGVRRDETLIELVVNTIKNVQKNPFNLICSYVQKTGRQIIIRLGSYNIIL